MTSIEDRLNGGNSVPWIADPEKSATYDKDCCSLNPLVGKAVDHFRRPNFRGDGEIDVIVLNVDGVGDVAVHCGPTVLANEMLAARPKPGETVGVKWLGPMKSKDGTVSYTGFKVVVEREAGSSFDWTSGAPADDRVTPDPDFPSRGELVENGDPGPGDRPPPDDFGDVPFE